MKKFTFEQNEKTTLKMVMLSSEKHMETGI